MSRFLICGGRDWCDLDTMRKTFRDFSPDSVIIHGGAKGADAMAGELATSYGMEVEVFRAEWNSQGRAAGPIRNRRMLDEGDPDEVVAFWDGKSKGTLDMISVATRSGVPVTIVPFNRKV